MKYNFIYSCLFYCVLCFSVSANQDATPYKNAFVLARKQIANNELEQAENTLRDLSSSTSTEEEIEKWFLLGQISAYRGNYDTAIMIFRKILDYQPDLARIRFELATCYMHTEQWSRADYHLRLAMAGKDLPENVLGLMNYYRYIVRKNKNWNVWFNIGAAPDSNVNNAAGGQECVATIFGLMCRDLNEPESVIGTNLTLGGSYEFKLSDQWRWKSDINLYSNIYDKHKFDDLYIGTSTGPRFVWNRGDVWLAGIAARRWYGWERYNWSVGARLDANYDFTRRLSGGLYLRAMNNEYDLYGDFLSGQTYSANTRLTYSFGASVYMNLRAGITREDTISPTYAYWQPSLSVGVGAELLWGFHAYLEPSIYWSLYDDARWTVDNNEFKEITERDFTHRYALSLSNNKLDIWGFVPTITFSYTQRDSNMWQREYNKTAIEFTMHQKF